MTHRRSGGKREALLESKGICSKGDMGIGGVAV